MEITLRCSTCQGQYDTEYPRWQCHCGGYLELDFRPTFNLSDISSGPHSMWRYIKALPFEQGINPVTLGEGMTPLLASEGPLGKVFLKSDYLMPTGSYKDRGTSLMLTQLSQWGVDKIIEDSSGNAGASVAAYSSLAGIEADIYIPEYTSAGKAIQIALYGGNLIKIPGSREDTAAAAWQAAEHTFYASHNWSPYFVHGVKTLAYEIWEQLGFKAPSSVIVPVGNGSLVLGLAQGFTDLLLTGEIDRLPKIYGVQAQACAPLAEAFAQGLGQAVSVDKKPTVAEGIASALPVKGDGILRSVRAGGGGIISVSEKEILDALKILIKMGHYVEPTSAVAVAGLLKLRQQGIIGASEQPVVELTGNGLKATDKLVEYFRL